MDQNIILIIFYSYVLGSIPFGLILTKFFLKKDLREMGSGNIGATNVLRTGKKSLAIATLILDILKGFGVILLTNEFFPQFTYFSGLICFIGHIFPVWLKFSGGKGVATYLGIILAISIKLGIVFGISWLIISYLTRYSSLASILSSLNVFSHRENLIRLKNGSEHKIKF